MTIRTVISYYNPTCFSGEINANYANKFTRESVEVKKMEKDVQTLTIWEHLSREATLANDF